MKLNKKLTLAFTCVLVVFALLLILFDNLFIDMFYISKKKEDLNEVFSAVVEYIDKEEDVNRDNLSRETMLLSMKSGTMICVFDMTGENIDNRPNVAYKNISETRMKFHGVDINSSEMLEKYVTTTPINVNFDVRNEDKDNKNIGIIGELKKNDESIGYAFIYTSFTMVKANTGIFNAFTLYAVLVLLVISMIISMLLSNGLVKPLKEAKEKAKKMASLDFSTKLEVKSKDEIGDLAVSINKLSDELEKSINSLKEANTKLEQDIKLKERINRLREEFISDVSHELKTPISIISGYSEALKLEGLSQDDINEYADIIIDESKRMNKLVRDLLKFTQIESGFLSLDQEDFSISELVSAVIKPYELRIKEKQINLELSVDDIIVNGDYDMMETVLNNYFANAINHVSKDRIIRVSGKKRDNKYRVFVYNSGEEISIENQKRIWDSFYKADKSRSRQYGGSGLGLAIVKSIMDTYKNEYGVRNIMDGVEFYFDLNIKD